LHWRSRGANYILNRLKECDESWCKNGCCWWVKSVTEWG
jgi:hypothetical protein